MKKRRNGLTIPEIIVIIAVISFICLVVIPALGNTNRLHQSELCKNNLRKLAFAVIGYTQTNDVKSLESYGGAHFWMFQIAPYLGDKELKLTFINPDNPYQGARFNYNIDPEQELPITVETLRCPSTFKEPKSYAYQGSSGAGSMGTARIPYRYHASNMVGSYGLNSWAGGWYGGFNPDIPSDSTRRLKSYRESGPIDPEIPLFADCIWLGAQPKSYDIIPGNNYSLNTGYAGSGMGRFATNRHGRVTNVVYWEGHAKTIMLGELWNQQWHKDFDKQIIKF